MADQIKPATSGAVRNIVLAVLLPLAFFIVVEGVLRIAGVGEDRELFHTVQQHGKTWMQVNQNVSRRYFVAQPEFAREAEEALVYPQKPANLVRIVCLGGSSMAGFPYSFNATMPGMLYTRLKQLFPNKTIEVINLGIPAVSSFAVRDLMTDVVDLEPDAVLIYAGHNEFYGALGVASGFRFGQNRSLINMSLDLQSFRLFYAMQKLFANDPPETENKVGGVMQRMAQHRRIEIDDPLLGEAADNLYGNLLDAASIAESNNIPVYIGTLASNLADHPPFISKEYPTLPDSVLFDRTADQQWAHNALQGIDQRLGQDSTIADLQFQRGKWLLAIGQTREAHHALELAREHDLLRFRAPAVFNQKIKAVCNNSAARLIDVEAALKTASQNGIIGREMMTEHLHPTIDGYRIIMESFLQALLADGIPGSSETAESLPAQELHVTTLDAQMGAEQIAKLTTEWPYREIVRLPVEADSALLPQLRSVARRFAAGQLKWGGAHLQYADQIPAGEFIDAAVAEYLAVLNFYPEKYMGAAASGVYLALAGLYQNDGRLQKASQTLLAGLQANKNDPQINAALGRLLVSQREFTEAEIRLELALRNRSQFSDSEYAQLLFLRGGCLANARKIEEARAVFRQVLQINPDHRQAEAFLRSLP